MPDKILDYVNPNYLNDDWNTVNDMVIDGKAAMMIMGDWIPGIYWAKKFNDFGWIPAPGNTGIYQALSDSFVLPKKVKNHDAAIAWLKICGSKEGQDAFNPLKGSIPARTDADMTQVQRVPEVDDGAVEDQDKIVPSIVHGSAAKLSFMTDYMNTINVFATKKDVDAATSGLRSKAATDADFRSSTIATSEGGRLRRPPQHSKSDGPSCAATT